MNEKDFFGLLKKHKAYYHCLKNGNGKRLTNLVRYTGGYDGGGGKTLRYVGEEYVNMAMIEENPTALYQLAEELNSAIIENFGYLYDAFCGAPEGGKALALLLAFIRKRRYVYSDKTTRRDVMTGQKWNEFSFDRHSIKKGERVVIVEDVLNNFSTADILVELINNSGGIVVAIAALLNRSEKTQSIYESGVQLDNPKIPVISLVNKPLRQYRQDDPCVAEDVKNSNVTWEPKENWGWLMEQVKISKCLI